MGHKHSQAFAGPSGEALRDNVRDERAKDEAEFEKHSVPLAAAIAAMCGLWRGMGKDETPAGVAAVTMKALQKYELPLRLSKLLKRVSEGGKAYEVE